MKLLGDGRNLLKYRGRWGLVNMFRTLDYTASGVASDVVPKFVSPSDPAAQWTGAHKGPAFFAYSDTI